MVRKSRCRDMHRSTPHNTSQSGGCPKDVHFGHWSHPFNVRWTSLEHPNSRNGHPMDVHFNLFDRPKRNRWTFYVHPNGRIPDITTTCYGWLLLCYSWIKLHYFMGHWNEINKHLIQNSALFFFSLFVTRSDYVILKLQKSFQFSWSRWWRKIFD